MQDIILIVHNAGYHKWITAYIIRMTMLTNANSVSSASTPTKTFLQNVCLALSLTASIVEKITAYYANQDSPFPR